MRRILIGLAMACIALPAGGADQRRELGAGAQTPQQDNDWCFSSTATDDQTIAGCTAMIQSGRGTENLANYYDNRATGYIGKALYDQAIADEVRAIALKPGLATAYYNRGIAYYYKGLYDQAIAGFTQAIALKPGYVHAYNNRGAVYEEKGLNDQAIADYRAALRTDPSNQHARDGLTKLGATP